MKILAAYDTDIGKSKSVNQDALCIKEAATNLGTFTMAILCDGMGGYSSGEVASTTVIRVFSEWFENKLPALLQKSFSLDKVREQWREIIKLYSRLTVEYGLKLQPSIKLGTTLTGILITENYGAEVIHVGDSRLYQITNNMYQLTRDHTKIGYLVAQGTLHLTEEEIEHHPERHVLSQCIGGSRVTCEPDSFRLELESYIHGTSFFLCSDGFRHEVTRQEMYNAFNPYSLTDENIMKQRIRHLINANMERGEKDNISGILLKVM